MRYAGFLGVIKSLYRRIGFCAVTLTLLQSPAAWGAPPGSPNQINTLARLTVRLNPPSVKKSLARPRPSVRVTCILRKGGQSLNQHTEIAPPGATSVVVEVASGPFGGTSPDNYLCIAAVTLGFGPYDNQVVSGPFAYDGDPSSSLFVLTRITTPTISFTPKLKN